MLLDTSVLVASAIPEHPHHLESIAVFDTDDAFSVAAHSLNEFYNTVTKARFYDWSPQKALSVIDRFAHVLALRTLTADESLSGLAAFAKLEGKGARVFDYMIGHHAVVYSIAGLITMNDRDFRPLFPRLKIFTPAQYLETL